MTIRKSLAVMAAMTGALALVLASCVIENDPTVDIADPWKDGEGNFIERSYDGDEFPGHNAGSMVSVTVTFAAGKITRVDVRADNETQTPYLAAALTFTNRVAIDTNNFGMNQFDVKCGGTVSKQAIWRSGRSAISRAIGGSLPDDN